MLRTPIEIQDAFRLKKLSLVDAGKVADLTAKVQAEIASRLRVGEPPRKVLNDYIAAKDDRHRSANDALNCFCKYLLRGLRDLDGRTESVSATLVEKMRKDLERAQEVFSKLLSKRTDKKQLPRGGHEEE